MDRKKLIKIPMNGELELLERFVGKQQPNALGLFISFKSQFRTMGLWQYDSIPAENPESLSQTARHISGCPMEVFNGCEGAIKIMANQPTLRNQGLHMVCQYHCLLFNL